MAKTQKKSINAFFNFAVSKTGRLLISGLTVALSLLLFVPVIRKAIMKIGIFKNLQGNTANLVISLAVLGVALAGLFFVPKNIPFVKAIAGGVALASVVTVITPMVSPFVEQLKANVPILANS